MAKNIITNKVNELISVIEKEIISKFADTDIQYKLLNAYNRYIEDETDSADYIFNINNQDNLSCCIKGGMTAKEIASLVNNGYQYFLFGGHNEIKGLRFVDVMQIVKDNLYEILFCVMNYPFVDEYRAIYTRFITHEILD